MSSKWRDELRGSFGLRVATWYAGMFVSSTIAVVWLTYALLSSSLTQRDHEIVTSTLREYASRYEAGGINALARAVELSSRTGRHERLFVRVLGPDQDALFLSTAPEYYEFDLDTMNPESATRDEAWARARARNREAVLEVASMRLWDGTIVQVGKTTESRDELLRHFRTVVLIVSAFVILAGVAGGLVLTRSTLQPIRHLIDVVRRIIQTGRTDARVPLSATANNHADTADAVDELSALFNVMLDRITLLIGAMRDALDHVAHDLRTPMARLRVIAERALESGSPEAQREALATCIEESDRILAMLNTLMDISEAETGTLRLSVEPVSLRALIAEVVELYEDVAEEKGVTVGANTAPDDVVVSGDRDRLRHVLANLLDNAIKYTPAGGQVSIEARLDGSDAIVTIRDTGIGIAPEDLPRIWDRLYRGDRSRTERGLGLGLSLVQAFVRAHGGRVSVDSAPGKGSTFIVTLPFQGEANLSRM
jgi:signal transduction histidine kinase